MGISQSFISTSYIDVSGIARTSRDTYRYAVKTVPVMERAIDEEFERDNVGYVILHGEMNCGNNTYRENSTDIFSTAGSSMGTEPGAQRQFKPVQPGTLEFMLNRFICNHS